MDLQAAERIADEITAQSKGLDYEDNQAVTPGVASRARAKKYRDLDRAKVNGMRIALSYVLECPLDMNKTNTFISQVSHRKQAEGK